MDWVAGKRHCHKHTQIVNEIDYFLDYYKTLHPAVFLSYEREAFYARDGSDFRVTFDDNILCRQEDLSLESEVYGTPILPEGKVLMEIKCSGGIRDVETVKQMVDMGVARIGMGVGSSLNIYRALNAENE